MQHSITAVISDKRGHILSIGKNSYVKTHPLQAAYAAEVGEPYKVFVHAEVDAIVRLPYGAKPHSIFVARVNNQGEYRNAKPCKICQLALKRANIINVNYTV